MAQINLSLLSDGQPGLLRFGGARMALLDVKDGFWGLRRQVEALVGRRLTDTVFQQAGVNGGASFARSFVGTASDEQALRDCIAAYQAAGFGQFEIEVLDCRGPHARGDALENLPRGSRGRKGDEGEGVEAHGISLGMGGSSST